MRDDPIRFEDALPYMWLLDVTAAIPWYRDVLGFDLEGEWHGTATLTGNPASHAQMRRDGVTILLSTCNCPDARHRHQGYFRINVDDIHALEADLTAKGVPFFFGPNDQPWGVRDFTIEDPEGNRLEFEGHLPDDHHDHG